jgi:hypothetical protein
VKISPPRSLTVLTLLLFSLTTDRQPYISPRAAPHTGAVAGAFSAGLIPEGKNGYATALRVAHGPRLRAWGQRASKSGNSGRLRGRIVIESGESLPETA